MSTSPVLAVGPGSMLGRYQVLSHLASGGMAEIFLARATGMEGFERYVVIKCIKPEHARDDRFVKMFIDEARLSAQLHHQNIAQVHDIGQEGGAYYFAMEYVHGENVRELLHQVAIRRARVPLEHVLAIVMGAAAGLHYAHEKRGSDRRPLDLVHRDVSPSNIIVSHDGSVKVVDFGIAKAAMRVSETRSGTLKGKIAYMSPEQCRGQVVDRRSDVFALGIVLYELATVSRLFKGESDYVTMNKIVMGEIDPPSTIRPDLPPRLEDVIMRALAREPQDRYPTAAAMLDDLMLFARDERISTSAIGLERYVRELFGDKPEPWLTTNAGRPVLAAVPLVPAPNNDGQTATVMPAASGLTPAPPSGLGSQGSLLLSAAELKAQPQPRQRRSMLWLAAAILASGALIAGALLLDGGRGADQGREAEPATPPRAERTSPPPAMPSIDAAAAPAVEVATAVDAGVPEPVAVIIDAGPAPAPSTASRRSRSRPSSSTAAPAARTTAPAAPPAAASTPPAEPAAPRRDATKLKPPD